jgi:hypothetical protein
LLSVPDALTQFPWLTLTHDDDLRGLPPFRPPLLPPGTMWKRAPRATNAAINAGAEPRRALGTLPRTARPCSRKLCCRLLPSRCAANEPQEQTTCAAKGRWMLLNPAVSQCYSIGLSWSAAAMAAPAPGAATTCTRASLGEQRHCVCNVLKCSLKQMPGTRRAITIMRHHWPNEFATPECFRTANSHVRTCGVTGQGPESPFAGSLALRQQPLKQGQRLIHHLCRDVICNLVREARAIKHESPKHHAHFPPSLWTIPMLPAGGRSQRMRDAWQVVAPWRNLWQTQQN